ncbi:uncharacterized protein [Nicotiana tomentosiformis]|nr:uncharacterized protein LOC104098618 isoform X2 [Nicotiana tomentosiformis]
MKNHYDYLKEKYQAWLPITKKTGNIYDPATNTILMSNSEWDEYIKAHPKAKALKTSPLSFPDLCTKLFEGSTATGIHGWSPSYTYPIGPHIEECMEKLEALEWEEPLYSATVSILCEGESYRKAWMKITEVNKLESWIKATGKKMGIF